MRRSRWRRSAIDCAPDCYRDVCLRGFIKYKDIIETFVIDCFQSAFEQFILQPQSVFGHDAGAIRVSLDAGFKAHVENYGRSVEPVPASDFLKRFSILAFKIRCICNGRPPKQQSPFDDEMHQVEGVT